MKFRPFEFRLFPKIRSKKKKKPKYTDTTLSLDDNFNYTGATGCYDNAVVDQSHCYPYINNCDRGDLDCQISRSYDNHYYYAYSGTLPLSELSISVPSHFQTECCYDNCRCLATNGGVPIICLNETETPLGTPNTIPKTRSRIKTNPWLPSPRTTPKASPTGTVDSILFNSAEFPGPLSPCFEYGVLQNDCSKLTSLIQIGECENEGDVPEVTSPRDETNNNNATVTSNVNARKRFSFTEFLRYDTEASRSGTPVVEKLEILGDINYQINFEYEEQVNDLLENNNIPRDATFLSIKDLLEDDYSMTADINSSDENNSSSDDKDLGLPVGDGRSSDEMIKSVTSEDDVTNQCDTKFYDEGCMHESIDTGYASVTRESDLYSEDDEFESGEEELQWDEEPYTEGLQYSEVKVKVATHGSVSEAVPAPISQKKEKRRSRSLADIELSLEEKVSQLREEKLLVQRKILEAKQEEIIRRQQLRRFQTHPVLNRKEVLLQTLHDLKARLDNQSVRLQSSYDTVLTLQKRFSQRRRTLPVIETSL